MPESPSVASSAPSPIGSFERASIGIWLFLPAETPEDRAIREEGERLRKAFPSIDFDHPGARTISPDDEPGSGARSMHRAGRYCL